MHLARAITLPHATALVVGTIIGASVFVQASEITALVPWAPGVALAWIAAGLLTLGGALVCAELASAFPRCGGVYVFLREMISPAIGFLWGWAMFWSMHTGIVAAIATVFARFVGYFVPMGDGPLRATSVGAILLLTAVNYLGVSVGSRLQTVITAAKVAAVAAIVVVGMLVTPAAPAAPIAAGPIDVDVTLQGFLMAVGAGLFAFGGWHMVTYTAEETVAPERTIPRALVIGIVIVTLCYVGLNAVYLSALPMATVITSTRVAADAFEAIVGPAGAGIISAVVLVSAFGALNGIVLAGPRVYYSMARDGLLFPWAAALHPVYRTPGRALILQGAWASVLAATGTYRDLFTRVIFTEWIFFGLLALGLVALRRRPGYTPRWPMPGVPAVPVIFALAALAIVVSHVAADPRDSLIGLAMVASGLPVYWWWARRNRQLRRVTDGAAEARTEQP